MCEDFWQTVKKRKLSPSGSPCHLSVLTPCPFQVSNSDISIHSLPHEILIYIFSFLDFQSFTQLCFVCKAWLQIWNTSCILWKRHCLTLWPAMCCSTVPTGGWKGFLVARKRIEAKFNSRRILQQLANQYWGLSTRSTPQLIKQLKREKGRQQASLLLESGVQEFITFLKDTMTQPTTRQNVPLFVEETSTPCPIGQRLRFLGSNSIVLKHRHCNKRNYFSQYSAVDPEYVCTLCLLIGEDGVCLLVRLIIEDATTEKDGDFFVFLSYLLVDLDKLHCFIEKRPESKKCRPRFICGGKGTPKLCCGEESLLVISKGETNLNIEAFKKFGCLLRLPFTPYFMTKLLCSILTSKEIFDMIDQACGDNVSGWDSHKVFMEDAMIQSDRKSVV